MNKVLLNFYRFNQPPLALLACANKTIQNLPNNFLSESSLSVVLISLCTHSSILDTARGVLVLLVELNLPLKNRSYLFYPADSMLFGYEYQFILPLFFPIPRVIDLRRHI